MMSEPRDGWDRSRYRLRPCIFLLVLLSLWPVWAAAQTPAEDAARWILVDTRTLVLQVMQGDQELARFEGIAIGRGGAAAHRRRGDDRTPLGTFRVAWINDDSPFHRFFGLDFPTLVHAEQARADGVITDRDFRRIESAVKAGRTPPQNTPLGGRIGIHGIGKGSLRVHRSFNWTEGCIALTNEEIDELGEWLHLGTRVVVR